MFTGSFASAETVVFWDIQGAPIPDEFRGDVLWFVIKKALKKLGCCGRVSLRAVGDDYKLGLFHKFYRTYVPEDAKDEERLNIFMVEAFCYAIRNRWDQLNFVLIMGDLSERMDIVSDFQLLKSRSFNNVLLGQPPKAYGKLGFEDWLKESLTAGIELFNQAITSNDDSVGS